jgi:2-polyprenyl-3-methyl-5-hydroxy-6-metoxy-1,4-benzoquinol methylase
MFNTGMDDIQKIQEELYEFPYHHIPKYVNKKFSTMRAYRGSHQYVAAINFLLSKINEIEFKNLLDVGCGDGKYLYEISKKYSSKSLVGIDSSEQAILFAIAMSPKIKFICGDITKNKSTLGKFDLITLIETLEHIKPELIPIFIKEIHNHIEPSGKLIVTVPSTNLSTSPKHYQHFNLKSLENSLSPYFKIEKYFFLNKITKKSRIIKSLLVNRFFAVSYEPILNKLFRYYESRLYEGDEKNCETIFIICSKN